MVQQRQTHNHRAVWTSRRLAMIGCFAISITVGIDQRVLAQQPPQGDAGAPSSSSGSLSSAETQQAEARTEMREGLAQYDSKDYEGALRHFRRATELVPEANLPHRHSAKALEGLTRWDEAIAEYQEYLRIKADVSDAQAVRDRIDEIRRTYLIGAVSLARCSPTPTEITVDGSPVIATVEHELRLNKGQHHIVLRASGYVAREIDIVVAPNDTALLECTMEHAAITITPAPASSSSSTPNPFHPVPPGAESKPWYGRWYTWVAAGALVAGGVVATILIVNGGNKTTPPASEGGNHFFP